LGPPATAAPHLLDVLEVIVVNVKTKSTSRTVAFTLFGVFAGAVAGLLIGSNIGGNWVTSFSLGSLHGYEATGMLGALIGALAVGAGTLWFTLRGR
jgi:hypothetical protein